MKNVISDKVLGLQPSGIRKFFDIVSEMPDAISLGVGEPDFDTPWRVREEGIYTLEKGRTFYTSNAGLKELSLKELRLNPKYLKTIVVWGNPKLKKVNIKGYKKVKTVNGAKVIK